MAVFGSRKRVLLVGNEGIALFGPTVRGIEREAAISWEVPNFDQQLVAALTRRNQGKPVLVLFDGADQTYRKEENIPQLSRFDRTRFVKRKLDLSFPSYPIRASVLLKPAEQGDGGREALSYLFVAIPETERLDRVGANMMEAGVFISGFGLLPAESADLVTTLSDKLFQKNVVKSRWSVLIGQHETGGLRQVIVKDGNLALTRMTPTTEVGAQGPGWVDEVLREFKATLTYIARFGYTADDGLDVIIVCNDIEKQFFDQKSLPVTNLQCIKVEDALAAIGVRGTGLGKSNFSDALHAAWAGRKRSLAVPVMVPSIHRVMVPRRVARIATIVLMLALFGLGVLGFNEYQGYSGTKAALEQKRIQKIPLDVEYAEASKAFDALPVKPITVSKALAVKNFIDNNSVNVAPTLNVLRKALANDLRISNLMFECLEAGSPQASGGSLANNIRIVFRFSIPSVASLEERVKRAEGVVTVLQQSFPGFQVKINSQFGNISRTGSFGGVAGKPDSGGGAGQAADETAEIELQGIPL